MSSIFVENIPYGEHKAYLAVRKDDPLFGHYVQVLPWGADAEVDRLRRLGLIQVFKFARPVRVREVDSVAHRLIRKR